MCCWGWGRNVITEGCESKTRGEWGCWLSPQEQWKQSEEKTKTFDRQRRLSIQRSPLDLTPVEQLPSEKKAELVRRLSERSRRKLARFVVASGRTLYCTRRGKSLGGSNYQISCTRSQQFESQALSSHVWMSLGMRLGSQWNAESYTRYCCWIVWKVIDLAGTVYVLIFTVSDREN